MGPLWLCILFMYIITEALRWKQNSSGADVIIIFLGIKEYLVFKSITKVTFCELVFCFRWDLLLLFFKNNLKWKYWSKVRKHTVRCPHITNFSLTVAVRPELTHVFWGRWKKAQVTDLSSSSCLSLSFRMATATAAAAAAPSSVCPSQPRRAAPCRCPPLSHPAQPACPPTMETTATASAAPPGPSRPPPVP